MRVELRYLGFFRVGQPQSAVKWMIDSLFCSLYCLRRGLLLFFAINDSTRRVFGFHTAGCTKMEIVMSAFTTQCRRYTSICKLWRAPLNIIGFDRFVWHCSILIYFTYFQLPLLTVYIFQVYTMCLTAIQGS